MSEANDYSYNIASVEKTIRLIELLSLIHISEPTRP